MANHKSALKRIRSNETKRLRNKYQHKTTRNAVRDLRASSDKKEAEGMLLNVISMLDKLAKNNIIHKNKAANLKSKLTKQVATL
ncbi:MAG: 30S ribosomal protein S20 [Flavobacterium sp.]|jgi:small subunit ribosomal protein S20|nr:30S ribosomal protein S20 [Flavobacterium sp.]|tara:strand:+ start:836 stop:1087 length:252 start_codon:yes stop_codon:yes gene_type:complete